jgi:hypothetical protein
MSSQISHIIDKLISNHIHPVLKQAGFKRKANTWNQAGDISTLVINLQSSQWNSDYAGSFTINLGVFVPQIYKICWSKDVPSFITESQCVIRCRIGDLIGEGDVKVDHWWYIEPSTNIAHLGEQVADTLLRQGIPFLSQFSSLSIIHDFLTSNVRQNEVMPLKLIYIAIIKCLMGDQVNARHLLAIRAVTDAEKAWLPLIEGIRNRLGL